MHAAACAPAPLASAPPPAVTTDVTPAAISAGAPLLTAWGLPAKSRVPCRHCGQRPGDQARRWFCWRCWRTPGLREKYPRNEGKARANQHQGCEWLYVGRAELPLPPEPTLAVPGSPEKMRVMRWRFLHGFNVFHPGDNMPDRFRRQTAEVAVGYAAHRLGAGGGRGGAGEPDYD